MSTETNVPNPFSGNSTIQGSTKISTGGTTSSALAHFIDENQNKLYNWSARQEISVIVSHQVKFEHAKAVTRVKNWWRLHGSLEGFTVIIAKATENLDCPNIKIETSKEDQDFIEHLADCKATIFDISQEIKKKEVCQN